MTRYSRPFRGPFMITMLIGLSLLLTACGAAAEGSMPATPTMTPQEQEGATLFQQQCTSCHSTIAETVIVGPSLHGIATRAGGRIEGVDAQTYLTTSIVDPGAYIVEGYKDLMPPRLHEALTEAQVRALVAYLMTLK